MKKLLFLVIIFCISLDSFIFAGQLGQNEKGIYYIENGGMPAKSKWVALDLDKNGKKEYYFFNADGFLLTNAVTPDGYKVDAQGRWINNGVVVEEGDEAKIVLEGLSKAASSVRVPTNVIIDSEPEVYVVRDGFSGFKNLGKNIAKQITRGVTQGLNKVANSIKNVFKKADKEITKEVTKEVTKEYKKNYKEIGDAIDYANSVNEAENIKNMANAYTAGADDGYIAGANDGYTAGANEEYIAGANDGYTAGANDGYTAGANDGYTAGANEEYTAGVSEGYSAGASDGNDAGASDTYNIMGLLEETK